MTKVASLLTHVMEIAQDEEYLDELRNNGDTQEEIEAMANDEQTPHEGWAKQLMYEVYGVRIPELMLYPDTTDPGQRIRSVVALAEGADNNSWQLYPNPATDAITVACTGTDKPLRLVVTDVTGKAVMEGWCEHKQRHLFCIFI